MNMLLGPKLAFKALLMLFSSRKLLLLALIPGVVSLFVTFGIYWGVNELIIPLKEFFINTWVPLSTTLLSFLLTILIAPFVVILLALPLSEPLAVEVDVLEGGEEVDLGFVSSFLQGITMSLKLVVVGMGVSLLLSLLSLIPVLGFIALLLNVVVWTPLILCYDVTDFIFSRRALSLSQRLKLLLSSPISTSSVGIMILPLLATPGLNLMGAPIAAMIGTLYARELERRA